MALKIERPLRQGDGVALVNPAGVLPERFKNQHLYVKAYLRELGFVVKDFVVEDGWEYAEKRAEAFLRAFSDPDVRIVLPLCGGTRVYDILPLLDYSALARTRKAFCGSSELSALTTVIGERSNMVTFFGPHLNFINPKASKLENRFTVRSFWNMLQWDWHGKNGLNINEMYNFFSAPRDGTLPVTVHNIYRDPRLIADSRYCDNRYEPVYADRDVTGELVMCSLEILTRLAEAGFQPKISRKILMIDALDMPFSDVLNSLRQISGAYNLEDAAAIAFSSVVERTDRKVRFYPELMDPTAIRRFLGELADLVGGSVPLFYGFPLGHCSYKLTLPTGIPTTIVAETGDLLLRELPYEKQ